MHRTINDWRLCLQTATTGHKHHTYIQYTYAHPFNGPFSGTTQVSRYQKGKTIRKQETVSGSGISWAVCKSAPRSRQPRQHPTSLRSFFADQMPILPPNQQRQSTEGTSYTIQNNAITWDTQRTICKLQWYGKVGVDFTRKTFTISA